MWAIESFSYKTISPTRLSAFHISLNPCTTTTNNPPSLSLSLSPPFARSWSSRPVEEKESVAIELVSVHECHWLGGSLPNFRTLLLHQTNDSCNDFGCELTVHERYQFMTIVKATDIKRQDHTPEEMIAGFSAMAFRRSAGTLPVDACW